MTATEALAELENMTRTLLRVVEAVADSPKPHGESPRMGECDCDTCQAWSYAVSTLRRMESDE